jgi:cytochrome c-type protein NapC
LHRILEAPLQFGNLPPLAVLCIICAVGAAAILVGFLVRRPPLGAATKVWLFFGLGALPIGAAASGNVHGYETTKARTFCGSCHVMEPQAKDAADKKSGSLASRHGRNALFGGESCYACHADYGMYGTVTTKYGGLRHVWHYWAEFRDVPVAEATKRIRLYAPFPNETCIHCHSTEDELWAKVGDHRSALDDVRAGRTSCASAGCHGKAHPTSPDEAQP